MLIKCNLPAIYRPEIQLAVLSEMASTVTASSTVQAHVYGLDSDAWSQRGVTWSNAPNLKQNAAMGNQIRHNVINGGGDTAHLQDQLVVNSTVLSERQIDVTEFVRNQPDSSTTFLVVQDARWDVALPSLTSGDTQPDGLQIGSIEGGISGNSGPRLRVVRLTECDDDGIGDVAEMNVFHTLPNDADTDHDGLSDGEEVLIHGSNPLMVDSDGDQVSDRDEITAGTTPTNPASFLRITKVVRIGAAILLEWPGVAGKTYEVERTPLLLSGAWQAFGSISGVNATQIFTDLAAPAGATFYRLRVQ